MLPALVGDLPEIHLVSWSIGILSEFHRWFAILFQSAILWPLDVAYDWFPYCQIPHLHYFGIHLDEKQWITTKIFWSFSAKDDIFDGGSWILLRSWRTTSSYIAWPIQGSSDKAFLQRDKNRLCHRSLYLADSNLPHLPDEQFEQSKRAELAGCHAIYLKISRNRQLWIRGHCRN